MQEKFWCYNWVVHSLIVEMPCPVCFLWHWSLFPQGNHNADNIRQRVATLKEKLSALESDANRRKANLIDNSAFLQFIWKTDVVESWIGKSSATDR